MASVMSSVSASVSGRFVISLTRAFRESMFYKMQCNCVHRHVASELGFYRTTNMLYINGVFGNIHFCRIMECTEYGSDQFWKFVDEINWVSRPLDKEIEEKKTLYSKEELKQFEDESRYLSGLISEIIYSDKYINVCFGGGDDFCSMDLPAEVVGRGKDFFLEHLKDVNKLIKFGLEGDVQECFNYIFQDSDSE